MLQPMKLVSFVALAVVACLTGSVATVGAAESAPVGTKRALLIGINKYQALPTLNGSLNDIDTMRHVLTTRWGFQPRHIAMLTDKAATRAGILAALERLAKESGPEDVVYIHYSGHGSQVEDFNGDETDDHLDETLVPHDGRTANVPDITDDELDEIFARLKARSVLIVFDSCHSGTATRSLDIRTRSVPRDTRTDLYRPAAVQSRQVVPLVASRYVLMTGAAANQEALDGPVGGRYHGFFSYSLAKSIGTSGPDASPRALFAGVEQEMKRIQTHFGRKSMPEPQLEAPPALLDAPVLSPSTGTTAARLPWLEVRPRSGDEWLLVDGFLLDATPGSTWAVYPPNETAFAPGKSLGLLAVSQVQGKDALVKPQGPRFSIPPGARAVAFLPSASPERVPIRLLDVPHDSRSKIEDVLRQHGRDVQIVEPGEPAQFLVDVKNNRLQLYSADGLQLIGSFEMDGGQWGAGLAQVLSRSANASELLTLENPSAQIKVEVRIAGAPPRQTRGIAVVADTQPAQYRIRRAGEPRTAGNSLQLDVQATADSYLTIVDVDSEGRLNLLFPTEHQRPAFYPDGRVRAGEWVTIPDSLQNGNHAGFHWDYAPPSGTDTVRVFASTDLDTAQAIRQRVRAAQSPDLQAMAMITTRSVVASSVGDLRRDLSQIATRGLSSIYDPTPAALTTPTASVAPAQPAAPPVPSPPSLPSVPPAAAIPPQPAPVPPQPAATAPPAQTVSNSTAADWTAASLTIEVAP